MEVAILSDNEQELLIQVSNPTTFEADMKMLSENYKDMKRILGQNALLGCEAVKLSAGEQTIIKYVKELMLKM